MKQGREPDDAEWEFISRMLPWTIIALGVLGLGLFGAGIWQTSWPKSIAGGALTTPAIAQFCLYKYFKRVMTNHYK